MIGLYYTGAQNYLDEQKEPNKSLGGVVSGTLIPNDMIHSIFPGISRFTKNINKKQSRVIAVKNETGSNIASLDIWLEPEEVDNVPTNKFNYEIGIGEATIDDCGNIKGEELSSEYAAPYTVTLSDGIGEVNKKNYTLLDKDSIIILYLRRTLKQDTRTQEQIINELQAINAGSQTLDTEENINIILEWT